MKIIDDLAQKLLIQVSQRPGAGVGLYTGIGIPKGTPVCEYKGDVFDLGLEPIRPALALPKAVDEEAMTVESDINSISNRKPLAGTDETMDRLAQIYSYTLDQGFKRLVLIYSVTWVNPKNTDDRKLIDAHPSFSHAPIGLGGFVNDILSWEERKGPEYEKWRKKCFSPYSSIEECGLNKQAEIEAGYNVHFWTHPEKVMLYLLALRDIEAGEELFVNYGHKYWSPFIEKAEKELASEKNKKS